MTRVGIWLMPRPPVSRSFHFVFPDDEDIEQIIDLCRPLKLSNFVPSLFRVANDLYALAPEERNPEYMAGSKDGISDAAAPLQRAWAGRLAGVRHVLWPVRRRAGAADPARTAHFERSGKARYISHERRAWRLRVAIDSMDGRPSANELGMLQWRPGSGNSWFLPGTPMVGKQALALDRLGAPSSPSTDGLTSSCTSRPRDSRGPACLVWNKDDKNENARADACYRELAETFARHGVGVAAPADYHDLHMRQMIPELRDACAAIKKALDPNGVISPGNTGFPRRNDDGA